MKEGCEAFLSGWEEEMAKVLTNRSDDETPVQKLCFEISQACANVDPSNVKKFDDTITVDGEPVKIVNRNLIFRIKIIKKKKFNKILIFIDI